MSQTFGKQPALDLCFLDKLHGLFLAETPHHLGASNVIPQVKVQDMLTRDLSSTIMMFQGQKIT